MRTPQAIAGLLAACLACDPDDAASPAPAPPDAPAPTPPTAAPPASAASAPARDPLLPPPRDPPDAELLARYPSLAHYPNVPPDLAAGLRVRDAPTILRGLARAYAATRWAHIEDWERLAHIRLADPSGYVRTDRGAPVPLSPGTYDLGCFGGFLEAVRLLWLPRVELADLIACDPPGSFETCADGAQAGRAALLQIGARLAPADLPRGLSLLDLRVDDATSDLAAALDPDALHLCSVSHRARARDGARMYHHMLVLDPTRDRLGRAAVFDTTGAAGVALRPMAPERLHTYVRRLLALNDTFRYDPASAMLTCLAVRRPALRSSP